MTFAKTFGQRHVLRFLSSHIDLSGCRITAASPVGLRVTDGVHQLCLKSTDGCIQRGDNPHSVAPEVIEVYGSTSRRTVMTKRGELRQSQGKIGVISATICAFYHGSLGGSSIVSVQPCLNCTQENGHNGFDPRPRLVDTHLTHRVRGTSSVIK